jgi:hypothetical protein
MTNKEETFSEWRRFDMITSRIKKLEAEVEQLKRLIDPPILSEEKSN